ncbi:hypothetical protein [Capillimicrobium parvum]|uniref:Uncharacterized protein n=1 Tax=Capillimicrobium parvum TaxID=2884022 RepID=A0A9E7C1R0_9ACTN|nr:hypothetical protein [Capillimicrobium parvum]UGS36852.1 hypothetical protein DSM104329_03263 [Capillimicrobium parvum]
MFAEIIDGGALLQVVWVSIAAGLGFSLMFSLAIAGAARASQERRSGQGATAALWSVITLLCLVACGVGVVLGVVVMLKK